MSSNRFVGALWLMVSLFGCEEGGGGDEGSAGQLGESCIGGSFCNEGLVCSAGVCMGGDDEVGEGESSEGESGEGESGESDVPSDPADTSPPVFELYEGPCTSSDECTGDTWCANDEGRSWCAMDCVSETDCPAHPSATALPRCEVLDELGGSQRQGCVLECMDESECPDGAQCFYTGVASKDWCGSLI